MLKLPKNKIFKESFSCLQNVKTITTANTFKKPRDDLQQQQRSTTKYKNNTSDKLHRQHTTMTTLKSLEKS